MRLDEAIQASYNDLIESMKNANLIQGEGSENNIDDIFFWNMSIKKLERSKSKLYFIYNIIDCAPQGYADNIIVSRVARFEVIMYSKEPIYSPTNKKVLENLNKSFLKNNWSFEISSQPYYNIENQMYIYDFEVEKFYANN